MNIRKPIACLIIFIFLISTAAAADFKKMGYDAGYKKGVIDGKNAGTYDCHKYGKTPVLRHVPNVVVSPGWSVLYKNGYKSGYSAGFNSGYQATRYAGLRR